MTKKAAHWLLCCYSRYLQTCCILFLKNLLYKCLNQKLRWIPRSLQIFQSYFLVDLTTSLQQTSWGISPGTYSIFWYSTGSTLLEISSFWKWCVKVPLFSEEQTNSADSSVTRNKPLFFSLHFYVSLHVLTIPIPHVLTIPMFLHEPTCSHNPSSHYLGQKHREFYVSLHGLTLSLMFTIAS